MMQCHLKSDQNSSGSLYVRLYDEWDEVQKISHLMQQAKHYAGKTGSTEVCYIDLPEDLTNAVANQGDGFVTADGLQINLND